jgi:hypothetical protein
VNTFPIHELLLKAWECTVPPASALYVSGPITTGERFFRWYDASGRKLAVDSSEYFERRLREVIEPNSGDILRAAARLRLETNKTVIEPASLYVQTWRQPDYLKLWSEVIERFVERLIMMPGWEFSTGCVTEIEKAFRLGLPVSSVNGAPISIEGATEMVARSVLAVQDEFRPPLEHSHSLLRDVARNAALQSAAIATPVSIRKDQSLDRLAESINVAQFVSFSPSKGQLEQTYSRVRGCQPNARFSTTRHAIGDLLKASPEGSINLRSYTPDSPQSREFIYGIRSLDEAVGNAERLGSEGLFVIANETVDVHDGGVSGVAMDELVEFTPDDTPRGVEKPGTASLPRDWALRLLETVYGFPPDFGVPRHSRLEFSLHPKPRGWRRTHTLGWELGADASGDIRPKLTWPNNFSRMLGDKVYGLLMAHLAGLSVPHTTVLSRRTAPFSFGRRTGDGQIWIRTSPHEQVPGKYTTAKGWSDPFALLSAEDPEHTQIASVLSQHAVPAVYSGAAVQLADGSLAIEETTSCWVWQSPSACPKRWKTLSRLFTPELHMRSDPFGSNGFSTEP